MRMGRGSRHTGIEKYEGPKGTKWIAHAAKRVGGARKTWQGTYATERQALAARRAWLTDCDNRTDVTRTRKTVGDALEAWFATHEASYAPITRRSYRATLDVHLVTSTLAKVQLYDLETATIQAWYNGLAVGARTKEMIHLRLCQALDQAVSHRFIPRNFARECEIARSKPRRGIALDLDQIAAFLTRAAGDHYHPLWHLALASGMRRGELLGLRWQDCDLERGVLLIRQTNVWLGRPHIQDRTKTESSARAVKIDPSTTALLTTHKARQSKRIALAGDSWQSNDLVFCTATGLPLGANNIHRNYKALLGTAGLPDTVKFHDMRHTHLSALIDAGIPIATVAERGGYRSPATLLAVYTHAYAASHDAAVNASEAMLYGRHETSGKEMASK
jgi:integrase